MDCSLHLNLLNALSHVLWVGCSTSSALAATSSYYFSCAKCSGSTYQVWLSLLLLAKLACGTSQTHGFPDSLFGQTAVLTPPDLFFQLERGS